MRRLYDVFDDDAQVVDSHVFRYYLFAFLRNRVYSVAHTGLSSIPLIRRLTADRQFPYRLFHEGKTAYIYPLRVSV
jgi:hypothetical protein